MPLTECFAVHRDKFFWFLLMAGVCNVVQVVLFYQPTIRCTACLLWRTRRYSRKMTKKIQALTADNPIAEPQTRIALGLKRWYIKNYRSLWMRFAWLLQGIALITAGAAGLALF